MNNIAQRVRNVREKLGLSQTELGQRINYSRTYISLIERGGQPDPDKEFIERIEVLEGTTPSSSVHGVHSTARMQPPHVQETPRSPAPTAKASQADPSLSHTDYVQAVSMLGVLFDQHPAAFRTVLAMIKGVHDQEVKG